MTDVGAKVQQLQRVGLGGVQAWADAHDDPDALTVQQVGKTSKDADLEMDAFAPWLRDWVSSLGAGANMLVPHVWQMGACHDHDARICAGRAEGAPLDAAVDLPGQGAGAKQ